MQQAHRVAVLARALEGPAGPGQPLLHDGGVRDHAQIVLVVLGHRGRADPLLARLGVGVTQGLGHVPRGLGGLAGLVDHVERRGGLHRIQPGESDASTHFGSHVTDVGRDIGVRDLGVRGDEHTVQRGTQHGLGEVLGRELRHVLGDVLARRERPQVPYELQVGGTVEFPAHRAARHHPELVGGGTQLLLGLFRDDAGGLGLEQHVESLACDLLVTRVTQDPGDTLEALFEIRDDVLGHEPARGLQHRPQCP